MQVGRGGDVGGGECRGRVGGRSAMCLGGDEALPARSAECSVESRPAVRLRSDEGLAAGSQGGELVGVQRLGEAAVALDPDAGQLAHVRAEATAACGDARGDVVKPLLRSGEVAPTGAVRRGGAHPLPDREQQLGRQAVSRTLGNRVEWRSIARAAELGAAHPAGHWRLTFTLAILVTHDDEHVVNESVRW